MLDLVYLFSLDWVSLCCDCYLTVLLIERNQCIIWGGGGGGGDERIFLLMSDSHLALSYICSSHCT